MFGLAGADYTAWQLKAVAVAGYTLALIGLWNFPTRKRPYINIKNAKIEQLSAQARSGP
jgi:hypothetical protein